MPYLIDGHNLIPKLGLKLADPDDEIQLIERLGEFCQIQQTQVEIYFDGATPGQPSLRRFGRVTAHFIRKGMIADAAIEMRLMKLGRETRNWIVVSSDRRVQVAAREVHARVLSSDEFAHQVIKVGNPSTSQNKVDTTLSSLDVEEWMNLFKDRKRE